MPRTPRRPIAGLTTCLLLLAVTGSPGPRLEAQVARQTLVPTITQQAMPSASGGGRGVWFDTVGRYGTPLVADSWFYTLNVVADDIHRDEPLGIAEGSINPPLPVSPHTGVSVGCLDFDDSTATDRLWAGQLNGFAMFDGLGNLTGGSVWFYYAEPAATPTWVPAFDAFSLRGQWLADGRPEGYDGVAIDDEDGTFWLTSDVSLNVFHVSWDGVSTEPTLIESFEVPQQTAGIEVKDGLVFLTFVSDNEIAIYNKDDFFPLARISTVIAGFDHFGEDLDVHFDSTLGSYTLATHTARVGFNPPPGQIIEFDLTIGETGIFDDMDGDGIPDVLDNCPNQFNPSQADANGDGIGNACHLQNVDSDGDGIDDSLDNCPNDFNPDQSDCDNDGIGDCCDPSQFCLIREALLDIDRTSTGNPGSTAEVATIDAAIVDLDRDGDDDIVTLHQTQYTATSQGAIQIVEVGWVAIRWNLGGDRLSEPVQYATSSNPVALVCVDLDGDLRTDIATADRSYEQKTSQNSINILLNVPASVSILYNDGRDRFRQAVRYALPDFAPGQPPPEPVDLVATDADADGRIDLVLVTDSADGLIVMNNTGEADPDRFTATGQVLNFTPTMLIAFDADADGLSDLATVGADSQARFHANVAGQYQTPVVVLDPSNGQALSIAAGQLTLDADPDLAVGVRNHPQLVDVVLLVGDGAGGFEPDLGISHQFYAARDPVRIAVADANADGTDDLFTLNDNGPPFGSLPIWTKTVAVMLLNGDEDLAPRFVPISGTTRQLALGRLGGDPFTDVLSVNGSTPLLASFVRNIGAGDIAPSDARETGSLPQAVAPLDVDNDLDLDLAVANFDINNAIQIFTQDGGGFGHLPAQTLTFGQPGYADAFAWSVAAGDLDSDAATPNDLVITTQDPTLDLVRVLANTGGTYLEGQNIDLTGQPGQRTDLRMVALADLNGDANPDAAVVRDVRFTGSAADRIAVLTGTDGPSFDPTPLELVAGDDPVALTIRDLDNDAWPDIAVANNASGTVSVFQNTTPSPGAAPAFTLLATLTVPGTNPNPRSIAAGTYPGDAGPFLVTASFLRDRVAVFINDGTGQFQTPVEYDVRTRPTSVVAIDLDNFGGDDIVVVNSLDNTISILLNNGDGTFAPQRLVGAGILPFSIAGADLDGNGRNDLVHVGHGQFFVTLPFVRMSFNTCVCQPCG